MTLRSSFPTKTCLFFLLLSPANSEMQNPSSVCPHQAELIAGGLHLDMVQSLLILYTHTHTRTYTLLYTLVA